MHPPASSPKLDSAALEASTRLTGVLISVGRGDVVAFEQLYRLTSRKLMGVSLRMCCDRTVAEDILQDVYLRVWKRASSFDPSRGSAIAWLSTIARNLSIDWLRAKSNWIAGDSEQALKIADELPLVVDRIIASADHLLLASCLDQLQEREREAIKAAFYGGASYADIARMRGVPLGTVKSWIRRGMIRLRAGLEVDAVPISTPTSRLSMHFGEHSAFKSA